jgi:hypothetical protein
MRRLIHLLLDLPIAQRDPALASDFVVQLADAAARGDLQGLDRLDAALGWLRRAGNPSVKTGLQIRTGPGPEEMDWSDRELLRPSTNQEQALLKTLQDLQLAERAYAAKSTATYLRYMLRVPSTISALAFRSESEGSMVHLYERQGTGIPEDLPLAWSEEWQALRAVLNTLVGNDTARHELDRELSYLDSLQGALSQSTTCPQALADVVVLVHPRLQQVIVNLSEQTSLTVDLIARALRLAAGNAALPIPQMLWSLQQGPEVNGRARSGEAFPPKLDIAWELLTRAGATLPTTSKGRGPKIEETRIYNPPEALRQRESLLAEVSRISIETFTVLFDLMVEAAAITREGIHESPKPPSSEISFVDPNLAVRLEGAICRNHGTLPWETCLALANSRARYHRYLDAGESASWQIQFNARPSADGAIDIRYAVVEQPLSEQFRRRFEAEDLQGRVRILWHLVNYAACLHTSILTLTAAEAGRQVDLREEELWNLIAGEGSGPSTALEGQTP